MASPQKENGFTPIANEIMEALAQISIPAQARRILDVILRLTYGYNRKTADVPISRFEELTGLHRPRVCESLAFLEDSKLIQIDRVVRETVLGSTQNWTTPNVYSFQKDYKLWNVVRKSVLGSTVLGKKGSTEKRTLKRNIRIKTNIPPYSPPKGNGAHLFAHDQFFDFSLFKSKFSWSPKIAKKIYEEMSDWSASKGEKRVDWLATARTFYRMAKKRGEILEDEEPKPWV